MQASSLVRGALFVADVERSTRFYNALGLTEVYFEGRIDDPSSPAVLAVDPGSRLRARILKQPGSPNFGMVGLFELSAPQPEPLPASPSGAPRIGEVALVFYVADMKAALTALRALGATWSPPPVLFRLGHLEQLETCLRDPDGVLINLIEADPAQQNRTAPDVAFMPMN